MVNYAKERKAFGKSLNFYGQIQSNIGTSYAEVP
jgi:alkylation response protein AidB-like acyl-CoA dehydrogenase